MVAKRSGAGARAAVLVLVVLSACAGAFSADAAPSAFDWRRRAGATLRVMLNRHPSAEWIRRELPAFERLTGVRTAFAVYPMESYFFGLDAAFDDPAGQPDVYVTAAGGALLPRVPRERALPLDPFIGDPSLTRPGYNINDFLPGVIGAFRRSGALDPSSGGGALWAIPVGFEDDGGDPESFRFDLRAWGLAINPGSADPEAAWLFIQYFTSQDFQSPTAREWRDVNPPRRSVFESPLYQRAHLSADARAEP